MTQEDYNNLMEFVYVGGGYLPHNVKAKEFSAFRGKGELIHFKEATMRDINFHRCYFSILNFIYEYLPKNFKGSVLEGKFYKWLKHLKKEYTVIYSFTDNDKIELIIDDCIESGLSAEKAAVLARKWGKTDFIEYDSISFGRMSQESFKNYVKEQLPYIYENVIGVFYEGEIYNGIIETIEEEYKKFLSKL